MPDPPSSSLFTRFVLENPWPAGILLLAIAAIVAWRELNGGTVRRLAPAGIAALLGLLVLGAGWAVETSGEHARRVVARFVRDAEAGDVDAMDLLLAPDAALALGRADAPGMDRSAVDAAIATLEGANRIESNTITRLRGYTADAGTGVVHLSCLTTTASSYGNVPSHWVIRVRRQTDGSWLIDRLACIEIAGRKPEWGWMR
ncbi:MAG: hypothetical protein KDA22_10430 [Phycisphaerales bacterium]|nr:hypothetical protein [Phycisphaerales bacterium]